MHIALFGGAFDPPHIAHQQVARALLEKKLVDEVWFVPVNHHPFGKEIAPNEDRELMLELIVGQKMRVERYELEKSGKSYSFETLEFLSQKYPQHTFSWVIGSDNLKMFHEWKEYQKLLKKYEVFVYPREQFPFEPLYPGMIALREMSQVQMRSIDIRQLLSRGESVNGLVDEKVERYILKNRLYGI